MSIAKSDTDEKIEAIVNGAIEDEAERRKALVEVMVQNYGRYLLNYLISLTRNPDKAEDLYQDLFCHVLECFSEDNITHIGSLRRKAFQLFCDKWRRQDRYPVDTSDAPPEHPVSAFHEPLDEEEEQRFKARFFDEHRHLGLASEQEDALWLHCRHKFRYREIAEIMGKPASTVGDWITRARLLFIEHLDVDR